MQACQNYTAGASNFTSARGYHYEEMFNTGNADEFAHSANDPRLGLEMDEEFMEDMNAQLDGNRKLAE